MASVRSDEIIERLRASAYIGTATYYPEYTDAKLLNEINDRLRSVFSDAVVAARAGYWLSERVETTSDGVVYVPPRAVTGGLESLAWLWNGRYRMLDEITPEEADRYADVTGSPRAFHADAERARIVPAPSGTETVRLRYYLRPSLLVAQQSSGTIRGRIDSVNAATRQATVNALPFDQLLSTPAAIASGAAVDVVRPSGWFSPLVVSETCSISGLVVTLAGMTEAEFTASVRVGHYLRAAGQTDWPAIPEEYHRTVADAAAVKVLMEMGLQQKADTLSASASVEFQRFVSLINPRTKSSPKRVRLRPYWARGT